MSAITREEAEKACEHARWAADDLEDAARFLRIAGDKEGAAKAKAIAVEAGALSIALAKRLSSQEKG